MLMRGVYMVLLVSGAPDGQLAISSEMISFGVRLNERIFSQLRNRLDCYGATESVLTVLLLFLDK